MSMKQRAEPSPPLDPRVIRRAHAWRRWLQEDEPTREGLLAFRAWLQQSEENRAAYRYIESVDPDAGRAVAHIEQANALMAPRRSRSRRGPWRWLLIFLLLVLLAVAVGLIAMDRGLQTLPQRLFADHATSAGERGRVELPDGTVIQLGARTAFNLEAGGGSYALELIEGEIFVAQPEGSSQMEVSSANGGVDATGARFGYRDVGDSAVVSVQEGEAIALIEHGALDSQGLVTGEEVTITGGALGRTRSIALRDSLAWRRGLLPRHDWTLESLAAEMRRYHGGVILIVDPAQSGRRVSFARSPSIGEPLAVLRQAAERLGIGFTSTLDGGLVLLGDLPWATGAEPG